MPSTASTPRPGQLAAILGALDRRYRIAAAPAHAADAATTHAGHPAAQLALVIERARVALQDGAAPAPTRAPDLALPRAVTLDTTLKNAFLDALARLIQEALRPVHGDPAFQAMVLRHRVPRVREYASLSAHADQDRRLVLAGINAVAHPGKRQRLPPGTLREQLERLHADAALENWAALADGARLCLATPDLEPAAPIARGLARLLDDPALARLQRLATLAGDDQVRQYDALWEQLGPRSGSPQAAALGKTTQRRGAVVEALAAQALESWARRLGEADGDASAYRVATSLRVPAALAGNADRAKTEWDVVLLRRAPAEAWDICLVAEAKSSIDAATTDYPRLRRGLRLLAQADDQVCYAFASQQGSVQLSGASLRALPTQDEEMADAVLYCCDAPANEGPRLLNAASRMQLLSAPASLAYAARLTEHGPADAATLAPVWDDLLSSAQWRSVLQQYATLRQVRELMVHVDDMASAAAAHPTASR
ncbi:hypothetical protein [Bordetella sp. N]|uniref:hypothetical protein n=1 Tax=Bordetella sp. N TaxID=1746199 RepID=UPI000708D30E|nr:hypothetical protein [Bordetella sp. N]ALM82379.1 hypothetical protein ASB57_04845 [Bordetella sp. N]